MRAKGSLLATLALLALGPGPLLAATCSPDRFRFKFNTTQHPTFHSPLAAGMVLSNAPRVWLFATVAGAATVKLYGYLAPDN